MAVELGLGVESALIGNLQLVDGIIVNGLYLFVSLRFCSLGVLDRFAGDGSSQSAEGQSHEYTVEPHLVGIDGFVPEHFVGDGAGLLLQLFHHKLHGEQVLLFWIFLIHSGDEMSCADVVEVIIQDVEPTDIAIGINHSVGVFLAILQDVFSAIAQIGVEHTFQFDPHHIAPFGLRGEIKKI